MASKYKLKMKTLVLLFKILWKVIFKKKPFVYVLVKEYIHIRSKEIMEDLEELSTYKGTYKDIEEEHYKELKALNLLYDIIFRYYFGSFSSKHCPRKESDEATEVKRRKKYFKLALTLLDKYLNIF